MSIYSELDVLFQIDCSIRGYQSFSLTFNLTGKDTILSILK